MKTKIVAFFGIICAALTIKEADGSCREKPVKSNIEVIKSENSAMVYYLSSVDDIEKNKPVCTAVINNKLAILGISKKHPISTHIKRWDNFSSDGKNLPYRVCAAGKRPVNLKNGVIEIERRGCRFSEDFCMINNETFFWDSTSVKVLAGGKADIWTLSRKPLLKISAFKDTNGTYILQLLNKFKLTRSLEFWQTNVDGLLAREVTANPAMMNVSQLASYLKHSEFFEFLDECMTTPTLNTDEIIFYMFILIVPLVACYFIERVFGLIVNCIIVSRTKRLGELNLDLGDDGNEMNELGASFPPLESPPVHFATDNNTIVTSQTGSTALVPCVINNIGDGMVSWIRRKDYHLLTVGLTTYSSDDRFQAIHLQHSEDWTLQIKFVQQRDAGLYECQVSSHPPTSIFIQLNVVEARAEIQGPSEKYLKPGSGLRLQCNVLQSTEPPSYVFWYHNNRMINYDVDRGINVTTDLSEKTSTLTITNAATRHSGNYSCVPSNAQPASTYVHILNGENPAAMQHGGRGLSWLQCSPSSWLLIFSVIIIWC